MVLGTTSFIKSQNKKKVLGLCKLSVPWWPYLQTVFVIYLNIPKNMKFIHIYRSVSMTSIPGRFSNMK